MFSTLLMGGGGHAREKDHQNVKSLIIFARDCRLLIVKDVLLVLKVYIHVIDIDNMIGCNVM